MKKLILQVKKKEPMVIGDVQVSFIGGNEFQSKTTSASYTHGSKATLTQGQILHSYISGGYNINIKSATTQTLNDTGTLQLLIEHTSSPISGSSGISIPVPNYNFNVLTSFVYRPTMNDIIISNIESESTRFITTAEITPNVMDADGTVTHIAFFGDVTGLMVGANNYVAGTWLEIATIGTSTLKYKATAGVDTAYTKEIDFKVRDNTGLESL